MLLEKIFYPLCRMTFRCPPEGLRAWSTQVYRVTVICVLPPRGSPFSGMVELRATCAAYPGLPGLANSFIEYIGNTAPLFDDRPSLLRCLFWLCSCGRVLTWYMPTIPATRSSPFIAGLLTRCYSETLLFTKHHDLSPPECTGALPLGREPLATTCLVFVLPGTNSHAALPPRLW